MTIIEALLAFSIALGMIASSIEAAQFATTRLGIARLQVDASLRAEALISRVGNDLPLRSGHLQGTEDADIKWTIDVAQTFHGESLAGYQVVSEVQISRLGWLGRAKLATLKIGRAE
jgi:hypothetical protein